MSDIDPQEFGRLQATCDQLERDVTELKRDMKSLLALANRSKGAFWASMTFASALGGGLTLLVKWFFTR